VTKEPAKILSSIQEHDPTVDLKNAFATCYTELSRIAHARLVGARLNNGLATTALVHESYLRLAGTNDVTFADKLHFLAYASRVIRSIVIDIVRQDRAAKRGGEMNIVTLNTDVVAGLGDPIDVEAVHNALDELAAIDAGLARLVEMRFFGGLTESEIAEATDCSARTVRRDWQKARGTSTIC